MRLSARGRYSYVMCCEGRVRVERGYMRDGAMLEEELNTSEGRIEGGKFECEEGMHMECQLRDDGGRLD